MNSLKPMLLTSLKSYNRSQFIKDVTAGIIVAIIALPLSIALALASGVGPEAGIFTAIVAGFAQVMAKELGREATVAELAEKMKMTEDEVKDIMKLALDAITVNGEGAVSEEQQKEEE